MDYYESAYGALGHKTGSLTLGGCLKICLVILTLFVLIILFLSFDNAIGIIKVVLIAAASLLAGYILLVIALGIIGSRFFPHVYKRFPSVFVLLELFRRRLDRENHKAELTARRTSTKS